MLICTLTESSSNKRGAADLETPLESSNLKSIRLARELSKANLKTIEDRRAVVREDERNKNEAYKSSEAKKIVLLSLIQLTSLPKLSWIPGKKR